MQNPEFGFGLIGFFVALVVEWFALWYAFGRHKDGRSQWRYQVWSNVAFAATALTFWPIAFGWSWNILLVIIGLLSVLGLALLIQKLQKTTCPACKELLRNPEWPSPLRHCYKCGEKLPPQAERAVGSSPPQSWASRDSSPAAVPTFRCRTRPGRVV